MYRKNCKKHTGKAIHFLTKGIFIHEIEGKYNLENELEIYLQFFTN